MQGIHNFRDAGGHDAAGGLKKGLLFRSGSLEQASDEDLAELAALGIRTICDLRTDLERRRNPDRLPAAARITSIHIPIKTSQHNEAGYLSQAFSHLFGKARRLDYAESMKITYREYVTRFGPQFSQVIGIASDSSNLPLLIHCTAGKDRTGFACGMIQIALGVPAGVVMRDYLVSNNHLQAFTQQFFTKLHLFPPIGGSNKRFLPLMQARQEYFGAAFDQITHDYGTVDSYLQQRLGLTDARRCALEKALMVEGGE